VRWATAFYAGLRRGELVGLGWEDVDLAANQIRVARGWDAVEGEIAPKEPTGRRKVPLPAVLHNYLWEHRLASDDQRVFGPPRAIRTCVEQAAKTWKTASVEPVTPHDARHASLMIAAGVSAKEVSVFMGHANIGVTIDLYGHLLPGSEAEAAALVDA
jgi:integrase